ncbi:MAG: MinD/ParA family protein [Armatimonadetes bacterium]|nr:MinD/ParA family protein [Armatimonadota bacterium]
MVQAVPVEGRRQAPVLCRSLAVTSGKGGVGKTNLTANLGVLLAGSGRRVIALDADLGLANMDVLLNIRPLYTLQHVIQGEKAIQDILLTGPAGLRVVPGASGILSLANLEEAQREALLREMHSLELMSDLLLLDTGAGIADNVLSFVLIADEVVLVTTPDPTAMTDAYAMMKVISQRRPEMPLRLAVNMSAPQEGMAVFQRLGQVAKQYLGVSVDYLGAIPNDPAVSSSIRARRPFVEAAPDSPASRSLREVARRLGFAPPAPAGRPTLISRMRDILMKK